MTVDPKPFMRIPHSKSGLNTLITLELQGAADTRVLVKNVQALIRSRITPLHADFDRVNMDRKIQVMIRYVEASRAGVKQDGGVLDFVHREVVVEVSLPGQHSGSIRSGYFHSGIGDSVHVRDSAANAAWEPMIWHEDCPHRRHQGRRRDAGCCGWR